jgi:hypothetical protein
VAAILAVAVPVVISLALLDALYYFLARRFRSIDARLLISSKQINKSPSAIYFAYA